MNKDLSDKIGSSSNLINGDCLNYLGKYVATQDFNSKKVISYGLDPIRVLELAKKRGYEKPVIFYIPKKDEVMILSYLR